MTTFSNIYPEGHKAGNIGIQNKKWKNVYAVNFNAESGSFSNASVDAGSVDFLTTLTGSINLLTTISSSNQYISGSNLIITSASVGNLLVDGNVGIGTSPAYKLHISSSGTLMRLDSSNGNIIQLSDTGSAMLYASFIQSGIRSDPSHIQGIRLSNNTSTAGSQAGIHFNTNSAYCGISGRRIGSNQMAIDFYTENSSRSTKMTLTHDGNVGIGITNPGDKLEVVGNIDVTGTYKMDNADIINSSKQQTGDFKTRSYIQFGLNGVKTTDDYMHGPGAVDRGEYVIPYDCVITAVGLACNSAITMLSPGDQCQVFVQKATGLNSNSWSTANSALTITSTSLGDYYKMVTGQTSTLAAGDRIRVWLDFTTVDVSQLTDPIVTIALLSD